MVSARYLPTGENVTEAGKTAIGGITLGLRNIRKAAEGIGDFIEDANKIQADNMENLINIDNKRAEQALRSLTPTIDKAIAFKNSGVLDDEASLREALSLQDSTADMFALMDKIRNRPAVLNNAEVAREAIADAEAKRKIQEGYQNLIRAVDPTSDETKFKTALEKLGKSVKASERVMIPLRLQGAEEFAKRTQLTRENQEYYDIADDLINQQYAADAQNIDTEFNARVKELTGVKDLPLYDAKEGDDTFVQDWVNEHVGEDDRSWLDEWGNAWGLLPESFSGPLLKETIDEEWEDQQKIYQDNLYEEYKAQRKADIAAGREPQEKLTRADFNNKRLPDSVRRNAILNTPIDKGTFGENFDDVFKADIQESMRKEIIRYGFAKNHEDIRNRLEAERTSAKAALAAKAKLNKVQQLESMKQKQREQQLEINL